MSGVGEASLVLSLISSIIDIFEAAQEIYDAASDAQGLPKKFRAAADQIPLVYHTLGLAEQNISARNVTEEALLSARPVLDRCKESASNLKDIFAKNIPAKDAPKAERLKKAMGLKMKSNKVKENIEEVLKSMELLAQNQIFQDAEALKDIKEAIEHLSNLTDEEKQPQFVSHGPGAIMGNISGGNVKTLSNTGSGTLYSAETQHFGDQVEHHQHHYKQKEDFSYRGSAGVCLGQSPYIDSQLFIGRESELDKIHEILKPSSEPREQQRLVLGGMGGIGKTQLAIAYAKQPRNKYESVFWLNASSETILKDSFRSIAGLIFDVQEPGVLGGEEILIHVHRWLSNKKNTQWLLIFDNYDDPSQFDISKYYPIASHGAIIVTTRRPDLVSGKEIHVKPLSNIKESLEILETRSQRGNTKSDPHAKRLADRLAGLPLALATAGAFLHKSPFTFERYLQEYETRWNINPKRQLQLREYQDRTLYTTWDLSYVRLQNEDPDAAQLLKLLAYFDNQSIWYELLVAGVNDDSLEWLRDVRADDVEFAGAMRTLTDYCFVEVQKATEQEATESWSMHNCVHDWTLVALNSIIDTRQYWHAFDCIAASINKGNWDSLGHLSYARLAAHARRLVHKRFWRNELISDIIPDRLGPALYIAHLLSSQVELTAAEYMYQRALAGHEKALGPEHTSTLQTVNNLAVLYKDQDKLVLAEQFYERALAGHEKSLGPEHTSTLNTVNNLAALYRDQDKLVLAEQFYERALAGYEKALGPEHTSTLNAVNNLAVLYRDQGKLVLAEQLYERALAGYEKALGPEHTSTLDIVNNLAILYKDQDKLVLAEQLYERALAGCAKALGPEHTSTLQTVNNLAVLYRDQGKLVLAEQFYERALAGREKALGHGHTSTLQTVNNLAVLYRAQGKLMLAEQFYERALAGKEKALGPEHTSTLNTVNNLAVLYSHQDKLVLAEQFYERALAGKEKALGPEHTSTLQTVNNLAVLYSDQGKLALAEELYLRALAGREKALGPEHTSTLQTVNNLANLYRDQGKLALAEELYLRAGAGRQGEGAGAGPRAHVDVDNSQQSGGPVQ